MINWTLVIVVALICVTAVTITMVLLAGRSMQRGRADAEHISDPRQHLLGKPSRKDKRDD